MVGFHTIAAAFLAVTTSIIQAHPRASDSDLRAEVEARNRYLETLENKNLLHCAKKLDKRDGNGPTGIETIAQRRISKVKALRRKLGLNEDGKYYKPQVLESSSLKGGWKKICTDYLSKVPTTKLNVKYQEVRVDSLHF
jgi:hypothetical protein